MTLFADKEVRHTSYSASPLLCWTVVPIASSRVLLTPGEPAGVPRKLRLNSALLFPFLGMWELIRDLSVR